MTRTRCVYPFTLTGIACPRTPVPSTHNLPFEGIKQDGYCRQHALMVYGPVAPDLAELGRQVRAIKAREAGR